MAEKEVVFEHGGEVTEKKYESQWEYLRDCYDRLKFSEKVLFDVADFGRVRLSSNEVANVMKPNERKQVLFDYLRQSVFSPEHLSVSERRELQAVINSNPDWYRIKITPERLVEHIRAFGVLNFLAQKKDGTKLLLQEHLPSHILRALYLGEESAEVCVVGASHPKNDSRPFVACGRKNVERVLEKTQAMRDELLAYRRKTFGEKMTEQAFLDKEIATLFGCTQEQIAHTLEEAMLRADTRVYIGPLSKNIFHYLPSHIEVFSEFPKKHFRREQIRDREGNEIACVRGVFRIESRGGSYAAQQGREAAENLGLREMPDGSARRYAEHSQNCKSDAVLSVVETRGIDVHARYEYDQKRTAIMAIRHRERGPHSSFAIQEEGYFYARDRSLRTIAENECVFQDADPKERLNIREDLVRALLEDGFPRVYPEKETMDDGEKEELTRALTRIFLGEFPSEQGAKETGKQQDREYLQRIIDSHPDWYRRFLTPELLHEAFLGYATLVSCIHDGYDSPIWHAVYREQKISPALLRALYFPKEIAEIFSAAGRRLYGEESALAQKSYRKLHDNFMTRVIFYAKQILDQRRKEKMGEPKFGYQKWEDPRVRAFVLSELQTMFSCAPEEIVENPEDISERTKVFIGTLTPQVLASIPKNAVLLLQDKRKWKYANILEDLSRYRAYIERIRVKNASRADRIESLREGNRLAERYREGNEHLSYAALRTELFHEELCIDHLESSQKPREIIVLRAQVDAFHVPLPSGYGGRVTETDMNTLAESLGCVPCTMSEAVAIAQLRHETDRDRHDNLYIPTDRLVARGQKESPLYLRVERSRDNPPELTIPYSFDSSGEIVYKL